jgi:demethylmenaquinone methyltransferase/2-methoxy-6-polyprenyl-1,4-benzoquinol methylase
MNSSDSAATSGKPLYGMFTAIPRYYDLTNAIFTWRMDKGWRNRAAKECLYSQPSRILDLCCGTGDLGITIARLARYDMELTGIDYSQPMLDIAARKAGQLARNKKISFIASDAAKLPFPDGYFDCTGISFAFRNLTYKNPLAQKHLSEVFRVLKPGGRFVIVESSQPGSKFIRVLFHLYLRWFVFGIGYLFSGNRQAYHYLSESAARFFTPEEVKTMLLSTGFQHVSYRPLFFGAAGIHVATK